MDNIYIERVLSGDSHAFVYFVKTYKDMAFSIALSILKKEHLAEEAVQGAYVQSYLSLSSFKKQSKFSTWFYRVVVHCSYKLMQKKAVKTVEFELMQHDVLLDESGLSRLLEAEKKQLVNEALLQIPANESLALRLFYLEELSIREICDITGWTTANTKVILHRGRNNMYNKMNLLLKEPHYGIERR